MFKAFSLLLVRFLTNTVIVVVSTLVTLIFAEWFVRTYMPCPDYGGGIRPAFYSNLFEYDEKLGWKGVPNLKTPYFSKDFQITVSHDAAGYRNISPAYNQTKNNFLLLGDSYTWGWGVEDNQTATAVFNSKNNNSNLYSLGIAGYGTDQEYLALQKHLEAYPDKPYKGVILLFYMNDLDDISAPERYGYPKPYYTLDANNQLVLNNVPVPKKNVAQDIPVTIEATPNDPMQKIQLLNFFTKGILTLIYAPAAAEKIRIEVTPAEKNSIDLATGILTGIKKTCAEHGAFFHVVFLMTRDTKDHNIDLIQTLSNRLTSENINHSTFYSRIFPRTDLWLDAHYTPYGQSLLAGHITDVINKEMDQAHH